MAKNAVKITGMLICLAMLFTNSVQAERRRVSNRGGGISFPLYTGFSFTSHSGTGLNSSVESVTGLAFGVGVDFLLLPTISVGVDMLYIAKGYEAIAGGVSTNYKVNYLQFPFQIKYRPSPYFYLHFGPYLASFIIEGTKEVQGQSTSLKQGFDNDYGLEFGLWIGFQPSNLLKLGLNTRFDLGLANIDNDQDPNDKLKTRTIMSMVTFVFML